MQQCSLLSLTTAVPPHVVAQERAKDLARRVWGGRASLFEKLSGVFDNAGIGQRNLVAPPEWYEQAHGWEDRNSVYLEAAQSLFEEVAAAAIEKAGLTPDQIDGVVTVSTTGIATPSLEARVGPKMGLRADVRRRRPDEGRARSGQRREPRWWAGGADGFIFPRFPPNRSVSRGYLFYYAFVSPGAVRRAAAVARGLPSRLQNRHFHH